MALYKRKNIYWMDVNHNGKRIQRSTGTSDKIAAQQLHDKFKADLWKIEKLEKRPQRIWMDAAHRWVKESAHKKSLEDDIRHLRFLSPHLKTVPLDKIDRDLIEKIAEIKSNTGVTVASVNRVLALIRSILNKAAHEWNWIEHAPKIKLRKENNHRIRWLSKEEANRIISDLPEHLADMMTFTLATGLRQSNVKNLKWENINLEKRHAWVNAEDAKSNKAIAVPLNNMAMEVLQKREGKHPIYVFTFQNEPVHQVSTRAWRKALKRNSIENFRWHDLRHTWASWHIQNGTNLQELQLLGGWSCFNMVLRYAHLTSAHLKDAAERIYVTNSLHRQ